MDNKKIKKLAALLVKANTDLGYGEYECHGEPHHYKKALLEREIITIIKSVLEVK